MSLSNILSISNKDCISHHAQLFLKEITQHQLINQNHIIVAHLIYLHQLTLSTDRLCPHSKREAKSVRLKGICLGELLAVINNFTWKFSNKRLNRSNIASIHY